MWSNPCNLQHKRYNWDSWKQVWYSTTCSRLTCFFYSSNPMGKHVHVRMTKYTKTHQRSESELTRSLRGINISIFFWEPQKQRETDTNRLRGARETLKSMFFPAWVSWNPPPLQYIYIYMYIYIGNMSICVDACIRTQLHETEPN